MKKFIFILSLCLLAVSCNQEHQQIQNTQVFLPAAAEIKTDGLKPSSATQIKKNSVTPSTNKSANIASTSNSFVTPSPTPSVPSINYVNMKIILPEGESNFSVELKQGQNACDNLYEAKAEGKIKSLTIKDAYLESMGSLYVYEIDGYKNNWILSLNAKSSSVGCSKVFPKVGDVVEWKFN